jgi:hypothetical protein
MGNQVGFTFEINSTRYFIESISWIIYYQT